MKKYKLILKKQSKKSSLKYRLLSLEKIPMIASKGLALAQNYLNIRETKIQSPLYRFTFRRKRVKTRKKA